MKELKVNHVYLAKHLPVRNSMSFFSTQVVEKDKDIQRIVVKGITESCYLISIEGRNDPFYVEKTDVDIVYLEDLGIIATPKDK